MLELWVERASAQSQVWLDDRLCDVIRHETGKLILDIAGVPTGEHDLFIVDGTRSSPITQIWLTRDPGGENWQRVSEVNIPLYAEATGLHRLDVTGLRLRVREDGVTSERIVPTAGSYRVGDYVSHHFAAGVSAGSAGTLGPAWLSEAPGMVRRRLWVRSALFDGEPYAPVHEARLMKVTLEPKAVLLRPDERTPILAVGHYTDGVGIWSQSLTGHTVTADNDQVAYVKNGVIFAKAYGKTTLHLACNGLYAACTVHVAAHPAGTAADVLTGLPPVAGIAWAAGALVVSTRTSELWQLDTDDTYRVAAGIPLQPPSYGGTDTLAAAPNGDLAVRLVGHPDVLVLDKASGYRKSRWAAPGEDGTVTAMTWDNTDFILALNTGAIWRLTGNGVTEKIASLPGPIVSIDCVDGALLGATQEDVPGLWRIPLSEHGEATSILDDCGSASVNVVAWLNGHVYCTDFHGGRVLRLDDGRLTEVATGLRNPGELAAGSDGSIFVAELGRGAVVRLLP